MYLCPEVFLVPTTRKEGLMACVGGEKYHILFILPFSFLSVAWQMGVGVFSFLHELSFYSL